MRGKEIVLNESQEGQQLTPMALIQQAQQSGADVERMQQLFELQLRWEENEARKAYNEAMSNFRAECPSIARTRQAHNSKYAGLSESIDIIKPFLSKHGLSHQWATKQDGNMITVECVVSHVLGHSERTSLTAEPDKSGSKNSIQAIGSTVSYLERYTLFAIAGLASREMDDDGNMGGDDIEYITEQQEMDILALMNEVSANEQGFLKYFGIESVAHMPKAKFKDAVKMLEDKRK